MALPASMRCIEITRPGTPDVLAVGQRPVPRPGKDEVLVRVAAAGVNGADCLQRRGGYPVPPGASDVLGLEIAGTVAELGEGVEGLAEGQAVCALVQGGGYAEYCTAAAPLCLPVPRGFSMAEAGGLPETYFTAYDGVFMRGGLKPGETLLVHGGASGIGTTTIQLARAFGAARIFATARNDEKCAAIAALGCDRPINYTAEDFVAVIAAETDKRGVDVVYDMIGGDYFPRNLDCLAMDGRHVSVSTLHGAKAEIDFRKVMGKRLSIMGSTLRPRPVALKELIAAPLRQRVWPLFDQGRIKPVVHAALPLAEAAEAHRMMEASVHIGKIVLTM